MGSSDEALLAGLAAGDRDAAAAFVRRFQRRVYGLALTIVRDPATAEDVAQEAFLRAWRHAATYDSRRGRVVTWLLTLTRNVAIDVIRLRRAEPLDPDVLAARLQLNGSNDSSAPSPIADRERLREALTTISPEQRRAVMLATFFGRTAVEIAELEDVPLGTAKTRIRAGMIRLRDALEVSDAQ